MRPVSACCSRNPPRVMPATSKAGGPEGQKDGKGLQRYRMSVEKDPQRKCASGAFFPQLSSSYHHNEWLTVSFFPAAAYFPPPLPIDTVVGVPLYISKIVIITLDHNHHPTRQNYTVNAYRHKADNL